jgi:glutamine synthetase
MLAAGLDGIKRELQIPEATEENVYSSGGAQSKSTGNLLPESLDEAIDEMEKDTVIKEALGAYLFERFINAKRLEWEDYRLEVSSWELKKYLPVL